MGGEQRRSRRLIIVRRRWLLLALLLVPLMCLPLSLCVGPPSYYRQKYAPAPMKASPRAAAVELVAEKQVEAHTCGFHALSSIYRAYGLSPEEQRLRFRLGTDKPVSMLLSSETGTVPPDIFRVLQQDGFDSQQVRAGAGAALEVVGAHLRKGQAALALTKPKGWHWVAVQGGTDGMVRVCDSMKKDIGIRGLGEFLQNEAYVMILVWPMERGAEGEE